MEKKIKSLIYGIIQIILGIILIYGIYLFFVNYAYAPEGSTYSGEGNFTFWLLLSVFSAGAIITMINGISSLKKLI